VVYDISTLDMDVVRTLVWEILKECVNDDTVSTQRLIPKDEDPLFISFVLGAVHDMAAKRGIGSIVRRQRDARYTTSSHRAIGEALWELVRYGILVPTSMEEGHSEQTRHAGAFYFTVYGRKAIRLHTPIPSDPHGYINRLTQKIPNINHIVLRYARESINGYNSGLLLSATITIGAAAEKSILLLIDAYSKYLPESECNKLKQSTDNRPIKRKFEAFVKSFNGYRGVIEKDKEYKGIVDSVDIFITGIFDLLRVNRNDAGHPTGNDLSKDEVFVLLQLFITYVERVYELIRYFEARSTACET